MLLSCKEPLGSVKLCHRPHSRHANDTVLNGHLRDQGILLKECNEYFFGEQE